MGFDLTRLMQPLVRSEQAPSGADDEALFAIDSLAEQGRYDDAAREVQSLLDRGIYDIRPLPYWLFGAFLEGGFGALASLFGVLDNLLGPSFPLVDPERRRVDYYNKRLTWLFETIDRALAYHEKNETTEWRRWRGTAAPAVLDAAIEASERVAARLEPPAYGGAATALAQLRGRLRAERARAGEATPPIAAPGTASADAGWAGVEGVGSEAPARSDLPNGSGEPVLVGGSEPVRQRADGFRMELIVDYPFVDLCRRLEAFETLIHRGAFAKAAVLAVSIAEAIEHFDPRRYFPKVFAQYAALQSQYVRQLSEQAQHRDVPAWQALAQHAQIDLDGFVRA